VFIALENAMASHKLHHKNASALRYMFKLTREQAREIIKTCPDCPNIGNMPKVRVNPRGLKPLALWQMDVTHVSEFGKLCYVRVTIDTFSHLMYASARAGEAIKEIVQHLTTCFSYMGVPFKIKTDNAPAYTSRGYKEFLQKWQIEGSTEIPYNPQGQAIVERSHQLLKAQITKLKASASY
nr:envelope protein [dwarf hamster endogenous retrovirus MRS-X14A, Peptide, 180 aa] [Dwarf hamster endogenous retrovirus MRS-X14A]